MTAGGLQVLAIVLDEHPLPVPAAGSYTPRALREGPLAALVVDAPERLRPRRRDLLAHQEVLAALTAGGPVIPMRFGTVAPDEARARAQLTAERERYLAALRRLTGRVEFNVKAMPATNALAVLLAEDASVRRLRDAARLRPGYEANVRLGEAVASALSRRAERAGKDAVRQLLPLSVDACEGPEVAGCALNASFLVGTVGAPEFRTEAARLAAEGRDLVDLRITGPLPCYSFVGPAAETATAGV